MRIQQGQQGRPRSTQDAQEPAGVCQRTELREPGVWGSGTHAARTLVTGADGLLGSYVVRELLGRGHEVRALVQPGSAAPTLDGLSIERCAGDLLADDDGVERAVRGCAHVVHCAAIADLVGDPARTFRVNVDGTRRVLEAARAGGVRRVVFIGSASSFAFGSLRRPGDERGSFPKAYRGVAYMESKRRAMLLVEQAAAGGLHALTIAPTFMLGAYDTRPSSGELIRQFLVRGLSCTSRGGRNFVFAGDVARAVVVALGCGRAGERYLVAGENLSYFDFFKHVARLADAPPPRWRLPRIAVLAGGLFGGAGERVRGEASALNPLTARLACLETYYASEKAARELGHVPTPVVHAIAEALRGLREYGHLEPVASAGAGASPRGRR